MESIAAGAQEVPYNCGEVATESVLIDNEVHDMCPRCASEAVKEFRAIEIRQTQERDAAQLRQYAGIMHHGADAWKGRPQIAKWFGDRGIELEQLAVDVLEGKL